MFTSPHEIPLATRVVKIIQKANGRISVDEIKEVYKEVYGEQILNPYREIERLEDSGVIRRTSRRYKRPVSVIMYDEWINLKDRNTLRLEENNRKKREILSVLHKSKTPLTMREIKDKHAVFVGRRSNSLKAALNGLIRDSEVKRQMRPFTKGEFEYFIIKEDDDTPVKKGGL